MAKNQRADVKNPNNASHKAAVDNSRTSPAQSRTTTWQQRLTQSCSGQQGKSVQPEQHGHEIRQE